MSFHDCWNYSMRVRFGKAFLPPCPRGAGEGHGLEMSGRMDVSSFMNEAYLICGEAFEEFPAGYGQVP